MRNLDKGYLIILILNEHHINTVNIGNNIKWVNDLKATLKNHALLAPTLILLSIAHISSI